MHHSFRNLAVISLCAASPVFGDHSGPKFVPPVDLSSDKSSVAAAWKNASSVLEEYINDKNSNSTDSIPGITNVTFSAGMFSLRDTSASKLQFHYSSPLLAATNGTKKVDGDSIYQIASITKVFTVLTGLLNLKDSDWERSVADLIPALGEYVKKHPGKDDPINTIQWDKVTPSNLAAQIAGLPANPLQFDLALQLADGHTLGFPPVNLSSPIIKDAIDPLLYSISGPGNFTVDNYVPTVEARTPNFLPWASPLYSNNGFILLTAALESILGKNMSTLGQDSILTPLQLSSTYYNIVPESESKHSVILNDTAWNIPNGVATGSGGVLSTVNDLAKFGTALLNSTLLPEEETRKWMKPVSFSGRLEYAMGRPWEIIRYTHASGAVTDLYTKAGDSGTASSFLVLIPEYNVGFTVLAASTDDRRNLIVGAIGDVFANILLPALNDQAAKEAEKNFAGTYVSTVEGLNSSVVLCVNRTEGAAPGLSIKSFISNGTAFTTSLYYRIPGARLTPSIFSDRDGKVAFRVATPVDAPSVDKRRKLFSGEGMADFLIGDASSYAGASLTQWTAEVDKDGKATTLSPSWLQVTLQKKA